MVSKSRNFSYNPPFAHVCRISETVGWLSLQKPCSTLILVHASVRPHEQSESDCIHWPPDNRHLHAARCTLQHLAAADRPSKDCGPVDAWPRSCGKSCQREQGEGTLNGWNETITTVAGKFTHAEVLTAVAWPLARHSIFIAPAICSPRKRAPEPSNLARSFLANPDYLPVISYDLS